jgi:hypothetical protein
MSKSNLGDRLSKELDELRGVRDELRLQLHLGAAEVRERWEKLEREFGQLETRLEKAGKASKEELAEVGEATRELAARIREGYKQVRSKLQR